jgi:hypothetical protein
MRPLREFVGHAHLLLRQTAEQSETPREPLGAEKRAVVRNGNNNVVDRPSSNPRLSPCSKHFIDRRFPGLV